MGDISKRGLDFIKRKEGYFGKAYLCPAGVWTIGWGTIRWNAGTPVKKGDVCTPDVAEKLLLKEVQRVEDAIDASIKVPLTQGQYDCICSFGYNLGTGWITGKGAQQATFIKELNKGNYQKVPSGLLQFCKAKDPKTGKRVTVKGLLTRRQEEIRELWLADYEGHSEIASTPAVVHETNPEIDPMPQSAAPATPDVKEVVTHSWTIRGALAAISGAGLQVYNWTLPAATEAGMEAAKLKTSLSGWDSLFAFLGTNMGLLGAMIVVTGAGIVIARRIQQA
jgi:lysozyme